LGPRTLLFLVAVLTVFVSLACVVSEISWRTKESAPDALRQTVGLPSVAVGNLNPSARNPGLEPLCTGLYDVPGGYCSYFALGVPYINFTMARNFTVGVR
jgi:hypothetical protein